MKSIVVKKTITFFSFIILLLSCGNNLSEKNNNVLQEAILVKEADIDKETENSNLSRCLDFSTLVGLNKLKGKQKEYKIIEHGFNYMENLSIPDAFLLFSKGEIPTGGYHEVITLSYKTNSMTYIVDTENCYTSWVKKIEKQFKFNGKEKDIQGNDVYVYSNTQFNLRLCQWTNNSGVTYSEIKIYFY